MRSNETVRRYLACWIATLIITFTNSLSAQETEYSCAICAARPIYPPVILLQDKLVAQNLPQECPWQLELLRSCQAALVEGFTARRGAIIFNRNGFGTGNAYGYEFRRCSTGASRIEAWRGGPRDGGLLLRHRNAPDSFLYYPIYDSVLHCFSGDDFFVARYGHNNDVIDVFRASRQGTDIQRFNFRIESGTPQKIFVFDDGFVRMLGNGNMALYGLAPGEPIVFGLLQGHSGRFKILDNGDIGFRYFDNGNRGVRICFGGGRWSRSSTPVKFRNRADDSWRYPTDCDEILPIVELDHKTISPPPSPRIWPTETCLSHGMHSSESVGNIQLPCCGEMIFGRNGVCRDRNGPEVDAE